MPQMACLFFMSKHKADGETSDTSRRHADYHRKPAHSPPYRHIHAFCMEFTLYHVKDNSP